MKTISSCNPFASVAAPSHPSRLASFWRATTEQVLALALLAVISVVIFFMAIGVASLALELSRALIMAGPFGLAALASLAAAGLRLYLPFGITGVKPQPHLEKQ